jgi:DnaJ-domain-containing protein 1
VTHDNFALLNQPRRPWLDLDRVQANFLALSAEVHPDRVHNASVEDQAAAQQRFTSLNAAFQCLRDPRQRLRHLLELERGTKPEPLEQIPSAIMDFYFTLGQLCRQADQFLAQKNRAASPLLRVQSFERAMAWRTQLEEAQDELAKRLRVAEAAMQELSAAWDELAANEIEERASHLPLDRLEQVYREVSYVVRWAEQVRERVVQLSI